MCQYIRYFKTNDIKFVKICILYLINICDIIYLNINIQNLKNKRGSDALNV